LKRTGIWEGRPGLRKGDFARSWGLEGACGVTKPGVLGLPWVWKGDGREREKDGGLADLESVAEKTLERDVVRSQLGTLVPKILDVVLLLDMSRRQTHSRQDRPISGASR
jgi:hypothetical protein